jgi:MFS family permease
MKADSTPAAASAAAAKAHAGLGSLSYPGWTMVAVCFVCVMFAFSAPTVTMPLIYGEVMKEFGWTRTQATMIYTSRYLGSSLVAIFLVGPFIERFGLRATMTVACLSTSVGMASFLLIHSLWSYHVAGVLFGLGGTTILVPVKVLISRWFNRNQGVAVGVAATGISVGGLVFPMLGEFLIQHFGWREAIAILSVGIWGLSLPLWLFIVRDSPTEEQLLPEAVKGASDPALAERLKAADLKLSWLALFRTHTFWCIAVGLFVVGAMDSGMLQHSMLFLKERGGFSGAAAAASLSGTFAVGIVAKLAAGRVYDRFSVRGIQVWYLLLAISIGMVFLVNSPTMLIVYTLFRGVAHGGLITEVPVLGKHVYGPGAMNKTLPVLTGIYGLGAAFGPLVLSVMFDRTGNYDSGFTLFLVACLCAAGLLTWVKPLYRNRLNAVLANP